MGSSATVPEEPFVSRVLMRWDTCRGFLRFVPFWSVHDSTGSQDNPGTLTCPSLAHSVFGGKGGSTQGISKCGLTLLGCGAAAVPSKHKPRTQKSPITQLQLELRIWILWKGQGLL